MAFVNEKGQNISYNCSGYMNKLKSDIEVYGGDKIVYVSTEQRNGVTIYKEYVFADKNNSCSEVKQRVRMTASALMELYKIENEII